ncbi:multicopper oxidase family protein [Amycolatopsis thailandensis]|uniref:multicopper oxidase family protein n=1 Tax=Amycolatopsis thailandensis TaxID=589330 RepID=UPI00365D63C3
MTETSDGFDDYPTDLSRRRLLFGVGAAVAGATALGGTVLGPALVGEREARADPGVPGVPELLLPKFADALPIPPVLRPRGDLTVRMRVANVKLHAHLPPTPLWTYDGHFPGPTIEVQRGRRLRVAWTNELSGPLPIVAVEIPDTVPGRPPGVPPTNYPGRDGATPLAAVAGLTPWTAVHVHGAHSGGGQDGWAENGLSPGESQLSEYSNDQPATALWYHDHAMHISRFTLMSGLLGMYLIRDDEESALRLPRGKYEVPLVLCDRNLDLDAAGKPTGALLHKISIARTEPARIVVPFAGPYTLVNGVIWPYFEVEPRWYRFRVLNASNARVFRLVLVDENNVVVPGALKVIGSDGGLLGAPSTVDEPLILSSSERADILIDFGALAGRRLRLVNTRPGTAPGLPDPGNGIAEPDVLQFRVGRRGHDDFRLPAKLAPSFTRLTPADLPPDVTRRLVVLTPPGSPGDPEMWEMTEVDPAEVTIPGDGIVQLRGADGKLRTYRRMSAGYQDATMYTVPRDAWEEWSFLNLGGPPHPMHIHLVRFQAFRRELFDARGFDVRIRGTKTPLTFLSQPELEAHETGWKDVIRVASGQDGKAELVTVAGRFGHATGRYVYHCHLLEHEHAMMRPFVVTPPEVLALVSGLDEGHHHG